MFSGDRKSATLTLDKLVNISMYLDGLTLDVSNRQKPLVLILARPAHSEIVASILSAVVNSYK